MAILAKPYPKVYLAGGYDSSWRKVLIDQLPIDGYDPWKSTPQHASYTFIHDDLRAIDTCALVVAYYPGGYRNSGMAAEMGYAAAKNIPVYYICEEDAPDMFLIGLSKRFFPNLDAFVNWWQDRVANNKPT